MATQKQDSKALRKQYKEAANQYLSDYKSYVDNTVFKQAKEYLAQNDTPTISYSIGVYDEDKRSYSIGENCKVFYPPLGMKETYAVTGYTYNVFTKEFTNLTFGDKKKRGKSAFEKFMPVNTEGNSIWNIWKDYLENTMNYQDEEEEKVVVQLALTGKKFNAAIKTLAYGSSREYYNKDEIITGVEVTNVAPGDNITTKKLTDVENGQDLTAYMDGTVLKLYTEADIIMLPEDSSYMFYTFSKLTKLDLSRFSSEQVTNMNYMFCGGDVSSMSELNLGDKFDTSNVTDMSNMFIGLNDLCSLDLGDKFDTSNVTNMSGMFARIATKASSVKLKFGDKFDTSKATDMSSMFQYSCCACSTFETDLKNISLTSATNIENIFYGFGPAAVYVQEKIKIDLGEDFVVTDTMTLGKYPLAVNNGTILQVPQSTYDIISTKIGGGWQYRLEVK